MRYKTNYDVIRGNADCAYRYRIHVFISDKHGESIGYSEFFRDKASALRYCRALSKALTKEESARVIIVKEFV